MHLVIFLTLLLSTLLYCSACSNLDKLLKKGGNETFTIGIKDTYTEEHGPK